MAKICCACGKEGATYKCPVCKEPYCSVTCCKSHKSEGCSSATETVSTDSREQPETIRYQFPTEDTVMPERLLRLRDCAELKECLRNGHVREIMRAILRDRSPTRAIGLAMTEPIFAEMADACLKVVEPADQDGD